MDERDMTLARDWDYRDLTGWFWSEKFNGVRAYFDGFQLWTRGGNLIPAPGRFLKRFPAGIPLDGELWAGHGTLTTASNAAVHGIWHPDFVFKCFDAPTARGDWRQRMEFAAEFSNRTIQPVEFGVVEHREHASDLAADIIAAGGEGAMFRNPNVQTYQRARTVNLMRIKERNLYAPWRQKNWSRAQARRYSESGFLGEETDGQGHRAAKQKVRDARPVVGLDPRLFPFDPLIENNIDLLLGRAADYAEVTRPV